jgi:hypothetical protein
VTRFNLDLVLDQAESIGLELALAPRRPFEGVGDLPCHGQRFIEGDDSGCYPVRQRRPLDQLHHERAGAVGFFQTVNVGVSWMKRRKSQLRDRSVRRLRSAPSAGGIL